MPGSPKPEVLIVGAGPVGLFAALSLVKRGVRPMIVDRDWRTGAHSYALALHPASLALLDEVGFGDEVRSRAHRIETIALYDPGGRRAEIGVGDPAGGDAFLAVMPQDALEGLFERTLKGESAGVLWNHDASKLVPQDDRVAVTIDELVKESMGYSVTHTEWLVGRSREVAVPMVIGADGHRSLVRRALGIDFPEVGPTQHFAVFECQTEADLGGEMRVVLGEKTTDVLWPLPAGRCRWSFQLPDFAAPKSSRLKDRLTIQLGRLRFPVLNEENLHALVAERAPWFQSKIGKIHWRIVVRFERRLASAFGKGRMWLAGDAAHMTGPVGMQSMNVGLREARDLAEIVAGILREGRASKTLDEYNRQRIAEWRGLLGLEGGLKIPEGTDPWIRQYADRLLACLPASGDALARMAQRLSGAAEE